MLEIKNLTKQFFQSSQSTQSTQSKPICNNINFQLKNGEILAILGASGSGKSTLLNMIAGLIEPNQGEIWLNHLHLNNPNNPIAPEKREIAMMFQDFALFPHLNVWENVAFGLKLRGVKKAIAQQQAQAILEQVGLPQSSFYSINQLSGGERQRVALARALILKPKLLLLDEPFSSLDTQLRAQLQKQIRDLIGNQYVIPAILVSHDPAEACLMADKIAILADGDLLQFGSPDEICAKPASAKVARLLGCLNVSESRYIPPETIKQSVDDKGVLCEIQSVLRLPEKWRITLKHPIFGELTTFQFQNPTAQLGQMIWVEIDEKSVIEF